MPYENIPEHIETAATDAANAIGVTLENIVRDTASSAYVFTLNGHAVGLSVHMDSGRTAEQLVQKLVTDFTVDLAVSESPVVVETVPEPVIGRHSKPNRPLIPNQLKTKSPPASRARNAKE